MKKFLIILCLIPLMATAKAVTPHVYNVYYPKDCKFVEGHLEASYFGKMYQVVCKEGGDISTYVTSRTSNVETPAKFNHIPAPVIRYIYLEEVK